LTGRAVAALKAIMLDERRLEWMQASVRGDSFDRYDGATFILHRQRKARRDPFAVHQYSAGATRTLIAAQLQTEPVPIAHGQKRHSLFIAAPLQRLSSCIDGRSKAAQKTRPNWHGGI